MKGISQILASALVNQPTFQNLCQMESAFTQYEQLLDLNDLEASVKTLNRQLRKQKEFVESQINVMSIHKSKGLESDYVIVNGLLSGILPNEQQGIDSIEAQRRLLFVGMTRAKKELHLISTVEWTGKNVHKVDLKQFQFDYRKRTYKARTSKFIDEISS
ncbi:MAG: 3'-5' exonuclease [Bacteroidota bacterium]|jgi:superfamily I DNA/RNA helicase